MKSKIPFRLQSLSKDSSFVYHYVKEESSKYGAVRKPKHEVEFKLTSCRIRRTRVSWESLN